MAIDGLDHDEDHGPTFEAKTPWREGCFGGGVPGKPKVMFCFVSMFWGCFFFFLCGSFLESGTLCLVYSMHPFGLLVFPSLSLSTATGTGGHS